MLEEAALHNAQLYISYLENGVPKQYRFAFFKAHEDLFTALNRMKPGDHHAIFEMLIDDLKIKPYLDIDKSFDNYNEYLREYRGMMSQLLNDIIEVFHKQYGKTIAKSDIKLLKSSGESNGKYKMSYHVIVAPKNCTYYFTSGELGSSAAVHFRDSLLVLNPIHKDHDYLDRKVYNQGSQLFRIIGSHKSKNDKRCLVPVDSETLEEIKVNDTEKLDYMLTYVKGPMEKLIIRDIPETKVLIDKASKKHNTNEVSKKNSAKKSTRANGTKNIDWVATDCFQQLMTYVRKHHPTAHYCGPKGKYHSFRYTNRREKCPISNHRHKNENFGVCETDRGYYMYCFSRRCKGKSLFIGYYDDINQFLRCNPHIIRVKREYLLVNETIEEDTDDKVERAIIEFLRNDTIKVLAFKSPMGSGKTTLVKAIFRFDNSIITILWIGHRQSLINQIHGGFKNFHFENYMEIKGDLYEVERIVIQLDSIRRIIRISKEEGESFYFTPDKPMRFQNYDMVVIDEVEGFLNHFSSKFLEKGQGARKIYNFVKDVINHARKLLILDADFNMRSKVFMESIGPYIMVHNRYRPLKKTLVYTKNYDIFIDKLMRHINEKKKKVCIVSMSSEKIDEIYEYLEELNKGRKKKDKIKMCKHTSKTDDALKEKLKDVNTHFKKYDVVLYSPTIESGVDFSAEHFDKMFVIQICGHKTCSPRACFQMIGRIRKLKSKRIFVYFRGPYIFNGPMFTFNDCMYDLQRREVESGQQILEYTYDTVVHKSYTEMIPNKCKITDIDEIFIRNRVEKLNKHPSTFMTVNARIAMNLNFEIEIYENHKNRKIKRSIMPKLDHCGKLLSIDTSVYDIPKLIEKRKTHQPINENEKKVLEKERIVRRFKIKNSKCEKEFRKLYEEFCPKEEILTNYEYLFYGKVPKYINHGSYDTNDMVKNCEKVINLLNILTGKNKESYANINLKYRVISHKEFPNLITDIAKKSEFYKDEASSRISFVLPPGETKPIDEGGRASYTRTIQSVLKNYGIILKRHKKTGNSRKYSYTLSVDERIKNMIDYINGVTRDVEGYKKLFKRGSSGQD